MLALAGAVLTSAAAFGAAPVAAGCKKVGRKCDKNKDCCDGARCKGDTKDKKGTCRCKRGFTTCNATCCSAGEECVGGACITPPGGCPPGADSCASGVDVFCAGRVGCECSQSTEGQTLCGQTATPGAACGQCDSSADCVSFGLGAFCVVTGSINCCDSSAQNICRLPCETWRPACDAKGDLAVDPRTMNKECCGGGTCCSFLDVGEPKSKCIDLLTHLTACGANCETAGNRPDFQPDRQCVNGECVEV